MTNQRRKARWRAKRAASNAVAKQEVGGYPAGDKRVGELGPVPASLRSPLVHSYADCHPLDWVPDFENAHLQSAAAGRLTIGDPFHHAPAPIDFAPPGRARC